MPFIPGSISEPEGWKVRIPPNVFQIYKRYGYCVDVRHRPGQTYIFLDWTLHPPQYEEFLQQSELFPVEEREKLKNPEVQEQVRIQTLPVFLLMSFFHQLTSKVKAWRPNNWTTVISCPIPYIPDLYTTGRYVKFLLPYQFPFYLLL